MTIAELIQVCGDTNARLTDKILNMDIWNAIAVVFCILGVGLVFICCER